MRPLRAHTMGRLVSQCETVAGRGRCLTPRGGSGFVAMGDKPTVVPTPSDDPDFARAVAEILAMGVVEPADAQQRLRRLYPHAVVRRRELSEERTDVWYVYREGHWVRGH